MAAGLGFKTFNTGDVLSAADVNGYLMQGVLVFADATARDAAITSPQEGQFAYTKNNDSLWYYSGSAWVASGATGDIEGVTAGTGISGGGTSGTVTITNSMATAIDAKGDLVVGTGSDTFSRLAVGTNGYTLVADSAETTGLKWQAPAASGAVGCVLYKSADQSINNGTWTSLTFNTEEYDTDSFHDNSTNTSRITIPSGKGGKYLFVATVVFNDSSTTGNRSVSFYKNGTEIGQLDGRAPTNSGLYCIATVSQMVSAVATDYFEVYAYQSGGSSMNVIGASKYTRFQVSYLGA
jgi:hypothetical protein